MVQMYTACTSEIDEIDEAVSEIMGQIDFTALKKNSGGLIFCHIDYIDSGVIEALCEALPFDVIGMTSLASATQKGYGLYDLSLTVFTSDEVSFECGMTNSINHDNYVDEIGALYKDIRSRVDTDPTLIFTFMPFMGDVSGYEVVTAMDEACNGIPLWGSITNSVDFTYETVQTIHNGKALPAGVAMMFVNGPVKPTFIVSSLPERNISGNRAIVTKSKGAVLYEINNMPILEYMANIGLTVNRENITAIPFMVYYEGSTKPVALGFYNLYEDGSVLTGGEMPVGTSLAAGNIDKTGILESAEEGLKQISEDDNRQATLLLPCITRYIMLSPDQESELNLIIEKLAGGTHPFMMGYSGGEICPVPGADGKYKNHFHNYTFSACILG